MTHFKGECNRTAEQRKVKKILVGRRARQNAKMAVRQISLQICLYIEVNVLLSFLTSIFVKASFIVPLSIIFSTSLAP